jgi:hypothetical protein
MSLELLQKHRLLLRLSSLLMGTELAAQSTTIATRSEAADKAARRVAQAREEIEAELRAIAPAVACAEQAMDEARAMARQGRRVPVAGGVLRVGSWS